MSDHLLWVETRDRTEPKTVQRVYSFFGHPSMSSSLYIPQMDTAFLLTPSGEKIGLEMKRGDWLAGYGNAEHLYADVRIDRPGDSIFVVARSPGVYDMGWHGGKSDPFLSYNFAKAVIHAGPGEACWFASAANLPLDLIPEQAPYELKAGDHIRITAKYLGKPVKASWTASYWTWDEHGDSRVKRGIAGEDGSFSVDLIQGGLWFLDAAYSLPQSGSWTATHSLAQFFKSGDMLNYNSLRYKTTLSVWVR
ncbi:MAG: Nickel uptake substrate-specific transmembrane region [Methanosaeta sp. PtaU1.Bin112]|nr:MAG: Nickel uptake substrate-specific transmembrane region [Methanosaeta sp. PtaU1.Bin112]